MEDRKIKPRVTQESVPGMQITLAHIIANPVPEIYEKMGMPDDSDSIGMLIITPVESAIIAADIAKKGGGVEIAYVDRFDGTIYVTGDISAVESSLKSVMRTLHEVLHVHLCEITQS